MTAEQKQRMLAVRDHMNYLEYALANLDRKIDEMVKPYESSITLLCTIPLT